MKGPFHLYVFSLVVGILFQVSPLLASDTLKIGIIPYKSKQEFDDSFGPLLGYIGKRLGEEVIIEKLKRGKLAYPLFHGSYDIGVFRPFSILQAKANFPSLSVFASHKVDGAELYQGGIVVKKDSDIQNLHDFAGKEFLFVKPTSTSGYRYPKGIFRLGGIDIDGFFHHSFARSHTTALKALANDEVDGIAIDLAAFNDVPEIDPDDFRILEPYDIPHSAYVFSPKLSPERQKVLMEILFDAHKNPEAKKLFDNPLGIEQWIPKGDDHYNALRTYLEFERIKPRMGVEIHLEEGAKNELAKKGDILKVLVDDILYAFNRVGLFRADTVKNPRPEHQIKVEISYLGDEFRCDVTSNHNAGKKERIMRVNLPYQRLQMEFPNMLAQKTLSHHPMPTSLHWNGKEWFIPYGSQDGIDFDTYEFHVSTGKKGKTNNAEINRIEEKMTFLSPSPQFEAKQSVEIIFIGDLAQNYNMEEETNGSWWNDRDKWDIFGVILAILTIMAGTYFSRRKRRRFQSMLYESNALLKDYVADAYNLENRLIEQKEKISQSLSKGFINENQFLILKHRLEDIEMVIHNLLQRSASFPPGVEEEISSLLTNHQLTEKDYSRIISLVKKNTSKSKNGI